MSPRLACLLLLAACCAAHAGRPLVTDDAGVIEAARCEVESYLGRTSAPGEPAVRAGSAQLACGVGADTQLALQVLRSGPDGGRANDLVLNGKTAFAARDPAAFALAWALTDAPSPGHGRRIERAFVNGIATLALGERSRLHANLGWSRKRAGAASTTSWALAIESAATDRLDLMAETFADDRDHDPWLQVAARWAVIPGRWFIDASWGMQAAAGRPKAATLGLKLAF